MSRQTMIARALFALSMSAFAVVCAAIPASAAQQCEGLTALKLPNVTILSATSVPAGSFTLPNSGPSEPGVTVPAFCRVAGFVAPQVKFEVWMPADWNKKFLAVGNGGLAGTISYGAMVKPLQRGYATASTNTGHTGNGQEASWAQGHFEEIIDFAHRSVHVTSQAAKAIIQASYGAEPGHSYFSGCSQGGAQALMEAQRYPLDFDGIIAGDPANYWTHHYVGGHLWVATALEGSPGSYIPPAKIPLIANAVNVLCDGLDGIRDGILNDPRLCHFDPSVLLCKGEDAPGCLTEPQVEALRKLYAGARDARGEQLYPGLLPGGEAGPGGWETWITGTAPGTSLHYKLGIPFLKYIVFENPNWDFRTFRYNAAAGFDSDVDFADDKLAGIFNATNPDLRDFAAHGGKLLQYHGWSDPDITPLNSINYYESVVAVMDGGRDHGLRDTQSFYRLFMVPGMHHCGGGPGPDRFDALTPLEQWVEHGVPPSKIVASHVTAGVADRSRPLCPYPQEARWTKAGSTDRAENFVCALPGSKQ